MMLMAFETGALEAQQVNRAKGTAGVLPFFMYNFYVFGYSILQEKKMEDN